MSLTPVGESGHTICCALQVEAQYGACRHGDNARPRLMVLLRKTGAMHHGRSVVATVDLLLFSGTCTMVSCYVAHDTSHWSLQELLCREQNGTPTSSKLAAACPFSTGFRASRAVMC